MEPDLRPVETVVMIGYKGRTPFLTLNPGLRNIRHSVGPVRRLSNLNFDTRDNCGETKTLTKEKEIKGVFTKKTF